MMSLSPPRPAKRACDVTIVGLRTNDVRFPTSDGRHGSDAVHVDPDYSAAYVVLETGVPGLEGHGLTFTIGRGNELCVAAIEALAPFVVGRTLQSITEDFAHFWRSITSDSQLRWVGPEKGVLHLATAALVNAVWDLYAKAEDKPLWELLLSMSPEQLVACMDFRYITDALEPGEAVEILAANADTRWDRVAELRASGFPTYTTSTAWMGYPDEMLRERCRAALAAGWNHFKMKVGTDLEANCRRAAILREEIGPERRLMMDANQCWDVDEAIVQMRALKRFRPLWIEEPTSPDDILGHARIREAIAPVGIATGEQCCNRVIFKQLMQAGAIDFCQVDACRLGGVNEVLAVMLMARKFGVPVCPHAGGVGLCEYVSHLVVLDYAYISARKDDRIAEYVDHLHEHFVSPARVRQGAYMPAEEPGYGITMKPESLAMYAYPDGPVWRERIATAG